MKKPASCFFDLNQAKKQVRDLIEKFQIKTESVGNFYSAFWDKKLKIIGIPEITNLKSYLVCLRQIAFVNLDSDKISHANNLACQTSKWLIPLATWKEINSLE